MRDKPYHAYKKIVDSEKCQILEEHIGKDPIVIAEVINKDIAYRIVYALNRLYGMS